MGSFGGVFVGQDRTGVLGDWGISGGFLWLDLGDSWQDLWD